jgi:FkbM family methyltransferase
MIDEIWAYGKYDYFGYRVAPGDTVLDTANIGTFSVYAAKICGASRVVSIEPFADDYSMLSKNIEHNQLANVTCVNQAVAGKRRRRIMGVHAQDGGSHSLVIGSFEKTIEVECCTLDDIFDRFALSNVDYLKMDCEGAEYEILENATSRLKQIRRISMETHTTVDRQAEDLGNYYVDMASTLGFLMVIGSTQPECFSSGCSVLTPAVRFEAGSRTQGASKGTRAASLKVLSEPRPPRSSYPSPKGQMPRLGADTGCHRAAGSGRHVPKIRDSDRLCSQCRLPGSRHEARGRTECRSAANERMRVGVGSVI